MLVYIHRKQNTVKVIKTNKNVATTANQRCRCRVYVHRSKTKKIRGSKSMIQVQPTSFYVIQNVFLQPLMFIDGVVRVTPLIVVLSASRLAVWDQVRSSSSKESPSSPPTSFLMACRSPVGSFLASRITCSDSSRQSK